MAAYIGPSHDLAVLDVPKGGGSGDDGQPEGEEAEGQHRGDRLFRRYPDCGQSGDEGGLNCAEVSGRGCRRGKGRAASHQYSPCRTV